MKHTDTHKIPRAFQIIPNLLDENKILSDRLERFKI
jgi:hypothetical protein